VAGIPQGDRARTTTSDPPGSTVLRCFRLRGQRRIRSCHLPTL